MNTHVSIRSRAAEEGNVEIPLWSVPLVLVVLYVCLFSGLGAIGLVGPDEPRYAAIARAMAETHDWVTPRLWGTPWFEKPVLYYWAAGAAMRLFGVSEFSARLPSALAALLAVLAATWTALRSYGLGAAWYTLLMLPTSVAMIGFARAASPDMLFTGFLTAAMAVAVEMLQTQRPSTLSRVMFGFFLGAAVLAKGPAAIVLAGGATLLWAAFSRQWRAAFQFLHPAVIAAFLGTALPWYILCALRNPDFLGAFIWQHNFERYLTPVFEHRQPFWFYVGVLFIALIPWSVAAIFIVIRESSWRKEDWRTSPGCFAICWAAFPILFFSFSQSKLPGYILPSIPPGLLLLGGATERTLRRGDRRSSVLMSATGALLTAAAILSATTLLHIGQIFRVPSVSTIIVIVISGMGGLSAVGCCVLRKPRSSLVVIVLLMTTLLEFMNWEVLPTADARLSARYVARDVAAKNPSGQRLSAALTRDWHYGLNYYLNRDVPEWTAWTPIPEWLVTNEGTAADLRRSVIQANEVSQISSPFAVLLHQEQGKDTTH